jgi:hypothetical protein
MPDERKHATLDAMAETRRRLRELADSPRWRDIGEQLRKATESPQLLTEMLEGHDPKLGDDIRERLGGMSESTVVGLLRELAAAELERSEPDTTEPQKRNKGGRPSHLTDEQIEAGIRWRREHPDLEPKQAFDLLRKHLDSNASDAILRRRIIKPASQSRR